MIASARWGRPKVEDRGVSDEKVQEIIDDVKDTNKVEHDEDEALMKQWEDQMVDFIPHNMLSLDLKSKSDEVTHRLIINRCSAMMWLREII